MYLLNKVPSKLLRFLSIIEFSDFKTDWLARIEWTKCPLSFNLQCFAHFITIPHIILTSLSNILILNYFFYPCRRRVGANLHLNRTSASRSTLSRLQYRFSYPLICKSLRNIEKLKCWCHILLAIYMLIVKSLNWRDGFLIKISMGNLRGPNLRWFSRRTYLKFVQPMWIPIRNHGLKIIIPPSRMQNFQ